MKKDVILVDVIQDVISKMVVTGVNSINYQPGRSINILKNLSDLDNSISYKGDKYPLIAMLMPVKELRGGVFYATAKIDRIVIATISKGTDDVLTRYKQGGTFKEILYPLYYEFLKRLSQSPSVLCADDSDFKHTKMDNPGQQPIGEGLSDYIDSIEILNLEFNINQIITC